MSESFRPLARFPYTVRPRPVWYRRSSDDPTLARYDSTLQAQWTFCIHEADLRWELEPRSYDLGFLRARPDLGLWLPGRFRDVFWIGEVKPDELSGYHEAVFRSLAARQVVPVMVIQGPPIPGRYSIFIALPNGTWRATAVRGVVLDQSRKGDIYLVHPEPAIWSPRWIGTGEPRSLDRAFIRTANARFAAVDDAAASAPQSRLPGIA